MHTSVHVYIRGQVYTNGKTEIRSTVRRRSVHRRSVQRYPLETPTSEEEGDPFTVQERGRESVGRGVQRRGVQRGVQRGAEGGRYEDPLDSDRYTLVLVHTSTHTTTHTTH